MLPPNPPVPTHGDFDPATYQPPDDGMEVDEEEATYELSSTEINILIYLVSPLTMAYTKPEQVILTMAPSLSSIDAFDHS
jgi:hypothetical protein